MTKKNYQIFSLTNISNIHANNFIGDLKPFSSMSVWMGNDNNNEKFFTDNNFTNYFSLNINIKYKDNSLKPILVYGWAKNTAIVNNALHMLTIS